MSGSRFTQAEAGLRRLRSGGLDNVLTVTLTTGASTLVEDPRLSYSGAVALDPLTASAAATQVYAEASDRRNGAIILRHSAGAADRSFRMAIFGASA